MKILIVDDDLYYAEQIHDLIESLGVGADYYQSSTDALSHFRSTPLAYGGAILGCPLDHTTGLELSERLREVHPRLHLMFATASNDAHHIGKLEKMGLWLAKPYSYKSTLALCRAFLRECDPRETMERSQELLYSAQHVCREGATLSARLLAQVGNDALRAQLRRLSRNMEAVAQVEELPYETIFSRSLKLVSE